MGGWLSGKDDTALAHGESIRAHGAMLREFHSLLKSKDASASYGGLVRVTNKRQEFVWVHPQFKGDY